MGRGGYDLTNPTKEKSRIGIAALYFENIQRKKREDAVAMKATEYAELKLIKSKKSRGIMAARRAEKEPGVKSEPADEGC